MGLGIRLGERLDIVAVNPEGVAGRTGALRVGDILVSINGIHCMNTPHAVETLGSFTGSLVISLWRPLTVVISKTPEESLGLEIEEDGRQLKVTGSITGGAAARAHDWASIHLIRTINGVLIHSLQQFKDVVRGATLISAELLQRYDVTIKGDGQPQPVRSVPVGAVLEMKPLQVSSGAPPPAALASPQQRLPQSGPLVSQIPVSQISSPPVALPGHSAADPVQLNALEVRKQELEQQIKRLGNTQQMADAMERQKNTIETLRRELQQVQQKGSSVSGRSPQDKEALDRQAQAIETLKRELDQCRTTLSNERAQNKNVLAQQSDIEKQLAETIERQKATIEAQKREIEQYKIAVQNELRQNKNLAAQLADKERGHEAQEGARSGLDQQKQALDAQAKELGLAKAALEQGARQQKALETESAAKDEFIKRLEEQVVALKQQIQHSGKQPVTSELV